MVYGFNATNTYGFNSGQGFGFVVSPSLAAILYNMDAFNVDASGFATIDNAGSVGSSADSPRYASNHIDLQATMSVPYRTVSGSDYGYFDVATKAHTSGTAGAATATLSSPTHHSNFFSLKGGKSIIAADKTYLDSNPESIARLVDGETVSGLSFDLTDIEAFYTGNEGEASGAYVQDVMTDLGSDMIVNGDFVDTSAWIQETYPWTISGGNASVDGTQVGEVSMYQISGLILDKLYVVSFEIISRTTGNVWALLGNTGIGTTRSNVGVHTEVFRQSGNTNFIFKGSVDFSGSVDNIIVREITASEIINYASTCRTNLDITNYGASNFLYTQDGTGRWLGMADTGTIVGASDGRNIDIQMTIPYNHLVIKDIDKIEGTLDSCTITYVDTTTEIVP